jgi:S1-C subfamily serine protease
MRSAAQIRWWLVAALLFGCSQQASNPALSLQDSDPSAPASSEPAHRAKPSHESKPTTEPAPNDSRKAWVNESAGTTVQWINADNWNEFETGSGKPRLTYREVHRNKQYIELSSVDRKQSIRIYVRRANVLKGDRWDLLANGHWKESSTAPSGPVGVPLGPALGSAPPAQATPSPMVSGLPTPSLQGEGAAPSVADLIAVVEPCVIRIDVKYGRGGCLGSGFLVSSDGIAVTNHHVMEGARSATATFSNGRVVSVTGALLLDKDRDIAVIRLQSGEPFAHLTVADQLPRKGEQVIALGAPVGLSFSVTEGIVSAIRDMEELKKLHLDLEKAGTWIQTSAQISGGNSGGPLVDRNGRVLGANTWAYLRGNDLNFAISCKDIRDALDRSRGLTAQPLVDAAKSTTGGHKKKPKKDDADPDGPAIDDSPIQHVLERLAQDREDRSAKIAQLAAKIETQLPILKQAMLADNEDYENAQRADIHKLREQIQRLATQGMELNEIDCAHLKLDLWGKLSHMRFKLLRVIDGPTGFCLVAPVNLPGSDHKLMLLNGVDVSGTFPGGVISFPSHYVFAAAGTLTFEIKRGESLTLFALSLAADTMDYRITLPEISEEPELSEDERARYAKIAAAREAKRAATKAARVSEEQLAKQEKAAHGKLNVAKQLLRVGKLAPGRERLKEIIVDYPDTNSAKEARELLKENGG